MKSLASLAYGHYKLRSTDQPTSSALMANLPNFDSLNDEVFDSYFEQETSSVTSE